MITPTLQRLMELRSELESLYTATEFGIERGKTNSVEQLKQIATRAIEIIEEWPEDLWPLENEEESWPDQDSIINLLKISVARANDYRKHPDFDTEFTQWNAISSNIFGVLYYFRPADEDEDDGSGDE